MFAVQRKRSAMGSMAWPGVDMGLRLIWWIWPHQLIGSVIQMHCLGHCPFASHTPALARACIGASRLRHSPFGLRFATQAQPCKAVSLAARNPLRRASQTCIA